MTDTARTSSHQVDGGTGSRWTAVAMALVGLVAAVAAALGAGVAPMPGEHLAVDEPQYLFTALSLAEDGDLDIADELADERWRVFTDTAPPIETAPLPDGRQVSPHDPLLPLLLAVPAALGGWLGAKLMMAALAGTLAALTLWLAVRRFAVPLPLAATGVTVAAASAPLAVYGQQLYPELPAGLTCLIGVAALTGAPRRVNLVLLAVAVTALPWLSVKYVPVAATLALLAAVRWWRARHRGDAVALLGGLAVLGGVYLVVHRIVWGGWTVYASGDYFQDKGEFAVVGVDPDYLERSWRLVGLLADRDFGLGAWQPAWLLLVPAFAAMLAAWHGGTRRGDIRVAALAVPLLAGWLVATYLALTMHGWWWPGRQTVVVLPLAVLCVLWWLAHTGAVLRAVAAVLGLLGICTYAALLVEGWAGRIVWVNGFSHLNWPGYQALRPLLPPFGDQRLHLIWAGLLLLAGVLSWRLTRARAAVR